MDFLAVVIETDAVTIAEVKHAGKKKKSLTLWVLLSWIQVVTTAKQRMPWFGGQKGVMGQTHPGFSIIITIEKRARKDRDPMVIERVIKRGACVLANGAKDGWLFLTMPKCCSPSRKNIVHKTRNQTRAWVSPKPTPAQNRITVELVCPFNDPPPLTGPCSYATSRHGDAG